MSRKKQQKTFLVSPKVSIHLVTWNSLKFLPDCLSAIFSQTFKDFSVIIVDNASTDETIQYLEKNYPSIYFIRNKKNQGFARAHNQAIIISSAPYVLVMNPDVILEKEWLAKTVEMIEKDNQIASIGGKLLKIRFGDMDIQEKIKTRILDSAGLKILKNRRVVNRGEGEEDRGQYDKEEEIFGLSGCCVLYRRLALEDIVTRINANQDMDKHRYIKENQCVKDRPELPFAKGEYFDEDFFAYKEDIDLAWRLRLAGWKNFYLPTVKAYHFRQVSISKRFSQSRWVNFLSFRNHLWLLLKNDHWQNFFRHLWFIFWYQLGKELYLLFSQPLVLFRASFSFWQKFTKMYKKRKHIMKQTKIKPKEIIIWFH